MLTYTQTHIHTHAQACACTQKCALPYVSCVLPHTRMHAGTYTQTHKVCLKWCDRKCQARGCKHLSLISYSLCSHLGLVWKRTLIYFAWQLWIFCETHLEKWGGKKTAGALCKRYRFRAQLLSFCRVSGSEVTRGDVVDTHTSRVGYCARWQKAKMVKGSTSACVCTVKAFTFCI